MVHYDGVEAGPAAADDGAGCGRAARDASRVARAEAAVPARRHRAVHRRRGVRAARRRGVRPRASVGEGRRDLTQLRGARHDRAIVHVRDRSRAISTPRARCARRATSRPARCSRRSIARCPTTPICPSSRCSACRRSTSRSPTVSSDTTPAHDDVAHLDPGSVQHHGAQMLAVTRKVASEDAAASENERRCVLRSAAARPDRLSDRVRAAACRDRARADGGRRSRQLRGVGVGALR